VVAGILLVEGADALRFGVGVAGGVVVLSFSGSSSDLVARRLRWRRRATQNDGLDASRLIFVTALAGWRLRLDGRCGGEGWVSGFGGRYSDKSFEWTVFRRRRGTIKCRMNNRHVDGSAAPLAWVRYRT